MRHGKSLLSLINQILDIAKLSSGSRCRPEYCRGDIVGYVTMICESHQPYARTRDIRIIYAPAEPSVEMDFIPEYVKQTVSNLLSNAIKFSSQGGRKVKVQRQNTTYSLRERTLRLRNPQLGKETPPNPACYGLFLQN